ncbi:hypothetical protein XELAEV_18030529mg [Xenopus laevis]|uniref:Uncharacterized protein n=1 Tax=Xenopus laevis TaxID=8355 RepID=A0A974HET7_XENLA|nr:hypothetical protein XELAEV_18030529mg [Xenopus laevis]
MSDSLSFTVILSILASKKHSLSSSVKPGLLMSPSFSCPPVLTFSPISFSLPSVLCHSYSALGNSLGDSVHWKASAKLSVFMVLHKDRVLKESGAADLRRTSLLHFPFSLPLLTQHTEQSV